MTLLGFAIGLLLASAVHAQEPSKTTVVRSVAIEWAAAGVEFLAVTVVVIGVGGGTLVYAFRVLRRAGHALAAYEIYKRQIGRTLLLALELLVASDVLVTVAFSPTVEHVLTLGAMVLIRTFLSWSLGVEIDGRWPWQPRPTGAPKD